MFIKQRGTLLQQVWHSLGYRHHLGSERSRVVHVGGWTRASTYLHFGWGDRVRLLLTGRLFVTSIVRTEPPSDGIYSSRIDWQISEPGE
jgi:hypothetical protein